MAFPGTMNIDYYRGDTYVNIIYPKDSNGNAYDLGTDGAPETQFVGNLNVATARGNANAWVFSEPLTFDYVNDSITMTIPAAVGATLSAGTNYVYDVEITKDTEVYTLITGSIFVTDDVRPEAEAT